MIVAAVTTTTPGRLAARRTRSRETGPTLISDENRTKVEMPWRELSWRGGDGAAGNRNRR